MKYHEITDIDDQDWIDYAQEISKYDRIMTYGEFCDVIAPLIRVYHNYDNGGIDLNSIEIPCL